MAEVLDQVAPFLTSLAIVLCSVPFPPDFPGRAGEGQLLPPQWLAPQKQTLVGAGEEALCYASLGMKLTRLGEEKKIKEANY